MRQIHELTDDEIVNAVARCGRLGLDTDDVEVANAFGTITRELFGITDDDEGEDVDVELAEGQLADRMRSIEGRLVDPLGDRIHLTSEEWGRRLEGLSAHDIAKALKGSGDY